MHAHDTHSGREALSRLATMHAMALAELAAAATAEEKTSAEAHLNAFLNQSHERHAELKAIRVVRLKGARLMASTFEQDRSQAPPPRRLAKGEKALYDLGQRLRTAHQVNGKQSATLKKEIHTLEEDGMLLVAAPFFQDTRFEGYVQIAMQAPIRPPLWRGLPAVLLYAMALLGAFWAVPGVLARWFRGQSPKKVQLLGAAILLAFFQTVLGLYQATAVLQRQIDQTQDLTRQYRAIQAGFTDIAGHLAVPYAPGNVNRWDVDAFRRPLGLMDAQGTAIDTELEKRTHSLVTGFKRQLWGHALMGFAVLFFFGLEWAKGLLDTYRRHRLAYLYISPAIVGMLLLVFFPFFYGITLSFTEANIYNSGKGFDEIWVGLSNFKSILIDFDIIRSVDGVSNINYQNFYWTLFITIAWTVCNVTIGVTVGLALALMLNTKGLRLRPLYRVLLILPWAIPNYITALIWRAMFHQQFGVINQVIQIFGGSPISWFDGVFTSFCTGVACNGWLSFPFMMVICLGGLQSISPDMYEAAKLDGARRWQQFIYITLPSLKPVLIPAIIISVVWTFNMFNIIFLISGGEPGGSNEILITQAYKIAFEKYQYGYAAAYSTVIFVLLFIYGIFQVRATRATEALG